MCVKERGRVCVCDRELNSLHWANCSFQLSALKKQKVLMRVLVFLKL